MSRYSITCGEDVLGPPEPPDKAPPLLLLVDVNKCIVLSDTVMNKSVEYTLREVVAELFWGFVEKGPDETQPWIWQYDGKGVQDDVPRCPDGTWPKKMVNDVNVGKPFSYLQFCRLYCKDKGAQRAAIRSFELCKDVDCRQRMDSLVGDATNKMRVPANQRTPELQEIGLNGEWLLTFPSFFKMCARLQAEKRHFAVCFRSFGEDLGRVNAEWNAFCERKHPLFTVFLEGVGSMDGKTPGIPDRRLSDQDTHTLYRDGAGPIIGLATVTNGPYEGAWDQWGRSKQTHDTRDGRKFLREECETIEGYAAMSEWTKKLVMGQKSFAMKDDFAWWLHHAKMSIAGKLMIHIDGIRTLFFDDNIGNEAGTDAKIVDCRHTNFVPMPFQDCLDRTVVKVNPITAIIEEDYFMKLVRRCDTNQSNKPILPAADKVPDVIPEGSAQTDVKAEFSFAPTNRPPDATSALEGKGNDVSKDQGDKSLKIGDLDDLDKLLSGSGIDTSQFGASDTTYKTLATLHKELAAGQCWLEKDEKGVRRVMEVVLVKLIYKDFILVETHEQMADGRVRSRNGFLPGAKKKSGETFADTVIGWARKELQINVNCLKDEEQCKYSESLDEKSMSYPLRCLNCKTEVTFRLQHELMDDQLLDRLGLPIGSMFSTKEMKKSTKGSSEKASYVVHFWSWYRKQAWEACQASSAVVLPDLSTVFHKLFEGNKSRHAFQNLLLQMFDSFEGNKLAGGMSGSLVLQVQPFDPVDGHREEAVIVKLDKADVISREVANSKRVFSVLSDRAARILGEAVFFTDDTGVEYGAFKLELAAGCWQVPELANGSSGDMLCTFKDLLIYESEQTLLQGASDDLRPFGSVDTVIYEVLGPGGMLCVLRKSGLMRAPQNLFGSFFYAGKDTRWNPFFNPSNPLAAPIGELYKTQFGSEMPNVRDQVLEIMKDFKGSLAETALGSYRPFVGLAHGDLNAVNLLIDAMDAVWIIDFAFSEEKPLCWDLAKLEIAFMFEYSVLPVWWRTLLKLGGPTEQDRKDRKADTWLGVKGPLALSFMSELEKFEQQPNPDSTSTADILGAIKRASESFFGPVAQLDSGTRRKYDESIRRLQARVCTTAAEEREAYQQAKEATDVMLCGEDLPSVLEPKESYSKQGANGKGASLLYGLGLVMKMRRLLKMDWLNLMRRAKLEKANGTLTQGDASPLLLWLGILQEVHRILGYFDIPPWFKAWGVYFINKLNVKIRTTVATATKAGEPIDPAALALMESEKNEDGQAGIAMGQQPQHLSLLEARELAARQKKPPEEEIVLRVRKAYDESKVYRGLSGLFSEVTDAVTKGPDGNTVNTSFFASAPYPVDGGVPILVQGKEVGSLGLATNLRGDVESVTVHFFESLIPITTDKSKSVKADVQLPPKWAGKISSLEIQFADFSVLCFDPGSRLRIISETGDELEFTTVIRLDAASGHYVIRHDQAESETIKFNPKEANCVVAPSFPCEAGKKLLLYMNETIGWVDAVVVQAPQSPMERTKVTVYQEVKGSSEMVAEQHQVDLNSFNHCRAILDKKEFSQEMTKYRVFMKARYSCISDVTGEMIDVLESAALNVIDEHARQTGFWLILKALISEADERTHKHHFLKGYLILGHPGSGKSCLLRMLVMYCLNRSHSLVPIFVPVADLVSRVRRANADSIPQGEALVDWYLRLTYGEDTNRYKMLRQAIECKRAMFLFDGIDEAEQLQDRIENCIASLAFNDNRIVTTARIKGQSAAGVMPDWLTATPRSLFSAYELVSLDAEGQLTLIEARLKGQKDKKKKIEVCSDFCQNFLERLDADERIKWQSPMMLSMLVAYWKQMMKNKEQGTGGERKMLVRGSQQDKEDDGGEDLSAVYRVAMDVLIQKSQAKQQADRHKLKERVGQFKEMLKLIACRLAETGHRNFSEADVLPLLDGTGVPEVAWQDLADAIRDGRIPLLLSWVKGTKRWFRFAYGSFQRFLAGRLNDGDMASGEQEQTDVAEAQDDTVGEEIDASMVTAMEAAKRMENDTAKVLQELQAARSKYEDYGKARTNTHLKQCQAIKRELALSQKECKELRSELEAAAGGAVQPKSNGTAEPRHEQALRSELAALKKDLAESNAALTKAQKEKALQADTSSFTTQIDSLRKERDAAMSMVTQIKAEKDSLQQELQTHRQNGGPVPLVHSNSDGGKDRDDAIAGMTKLRTENARLMKELQQQRQSKEEADARLRCLWREKAELSTRVQALYRSMEQLVDQTNQRKAA